MKLKTVIFLLFFMIPSFLFSSTEVSDLAQNLIDEFMNLRMNLALCENDEIALMNIKKFEIDKYVPAKEKLNEHECMIFENFFITERYNYLKKSTEGTKTSDKELYPQIDVNYQYYLNNKNDGLSGWWYVTSANVIGCYMSFHPVPAALKYGNIQKNYYKSACDQDEDFSYAVAHYAQWLFLAPAFYGGNRKRAEELFLHAIDTARNDAEAYFTNIYMSQYYFECKKYDKTELYLNTADSYLPGGSFVQLIRKMNENGMSTYFYKE